MRKWIVGAVGLLVIWWILFRPSWQFGLVVAGASLAILVALFDAKPEERKKIWFAFAAALLSVCGGYLSQRDARQAQREARENAAKANEKTEQITALTKEGRDLAKDNRELARKVVEQAEHIAALSTSAISEATGGDSFCYVDMAGDGIYGTGGLIASLRQFGRYPLSNVNVTIIDEDAAFKPSPGNILTLEKALSNQSEFSFTFLTRATVWNKLKIFDAKAGEVYRSFFVRTLARNGGFEQAIRMKRLPDGGWAVATIVVASYFDKRRGVVLEHIDKTFPAGNLTTDKTWRDLTRFKRIKVLE